MTTERPHNERLVMRVRLSMADGTGLTDLIRARRRVLLSVQWCL